MTSCTEQTFMAEITRLSEAIENLNYALTKEQQLTSDLLKTRELQEAEIQRLKESLYEAIKLGEGLVGYLPSPDKHMVAEKVEDWKARCKCGYQAKEDSV